MDYKIVLMRDAEEDLDRFVTYLMFEKKSDQAARNLLNDCTLSEYLSQTRFKMGLQRRERDRTGKAEITRDRANLTETILRVCDSNNEKNGQNFISVFEAMKNKRIID